MIIKIMLQKLPSLFFPSKKLFETKIANVFLAKLRIHFIPPPTNTSKPQQVSQQDLQGHFQASQSTISGLVQAKDAFLISPMLAKRSPCKQLGSKLIHIVSQFCVTLTLQLIVGTMKATLEQFEAMSFQWVNQIINVGLAHLCFQMYGPTNQ